MTADSRPDWARGTVVEAVDVADQIRRLTIVRPPSTAAPPGSHVDLRIPLPGGTVTRSYSVVESDARGARLSISVLLAAGSRGGSAYLHGLHPADTVDVSRPLQNFPVRVGAPRYVLLAGGIGITAILPMADLLRRTGADYSLVYAGRSRSRMAYLPRLLAEHRDRLDLRVSEEGGRADVAEVVRSLSRHRGRDLAEMYVCGPHPLLDDVRKAWADEGMPAANLRFETFGSSAGRLSTPFEVRLQDSDVRLTVGAEETLLDALVRSGVPIMYDCLKGECGLCVLPVASLDGTVEHRDVFLSERQREDGTSICACVSRVLPHRGSGSASLTLV